MANFKEEYNKVLNEISEKLKGKEELSFVNEKIVEISDLYTNLIVDLTSTFADQIDKLETQSYFAEKRLEKIEDLIFDDDNSIELLCPHCDFEFTIDLDNLDEGEDIVCPDCGEVIELDFNEDEGCGCGCDACEHDCSCGDDCNANCEH